MEDCTTENNTRKRIRATSESDSYSTDSKRVRPEYNSADSDRVDSTIRDELKPIRDDSENESVECERVHSEETYLDSPEVKKIRDDILDILDDFDTVTDGEPEIQDLDSVMKSFEEEILHPPPGSDSGELDYLLEASDDELGLPPAISPSGEQSNNQANDETITNIPSEAFGYGDSVGFENELPSYDPFGFEFGEETGSNNNNDDGDGEFVTVGGLFDYSEGPDYSEISRRPESLPAL
ncbi:hypothetical protein LguiA_027926 [Lonicera macranthoides]